MAGGAKLAKAVVDKISDLLTMSNRNFKKKQAAARPDERIDTSPMGNRPDKETLDEESREIGAQINALLKEPVWESDRSFRTFDPDTIMSSARRAQKPEDHPYQTIQDMQWVLSTPETHRKLNPPLYSDNPDYEINVLGTDPFEVSSDKAKVDFFRRAYKERLPEDYRFNRTTKDVYTGWKQIPMMVARYDPDQGAIFIKGHEGRHFSRALEAEGQGRSNYLTEIYKMDPENFPDLKTLDPNTPIYSDRGRLTRDESGNLKFGEPEKVGTLGELWKVIYGVGGVGALQNLGSYEETVPVMP